jgi:hypothetical protein
LSTLATSVLRYTGNDKSNEEDGEGRTSPETATTSLHEEYGRNGTDKKRTTAYQRHVVGLEIVETETLHESTHEVSDGVDTSTVSDKSAEKQTRRRKTGRLTADPMQS